MRKIVHLKQILVLGAGKSATCLIDYLLEEVHTAEWEVIVCDGDLSLAESKVMGRVNGKAISIDVEHEAARQEIIRNADLVISLLPPTLHLLVAKDCIFFKKHLLTASYVDDEMRALSEKIEKSGILFLCEMGLDPGIDHMSAMKLIHSILDKGGKITSFVSHCGGLVAPESDDNPWHYKISWNPRNIVMAGKAGARYKENGKVVKLPYEQLFDSQRAFKMDGLGWLAYYPNRDSLDYMSLYGLDTAETFMRTTLRYPEFSFGWNNILFLKLTDEYQRFDSDGLSIKQFYTEHLARFNATGHLEEKMSRQLAEVKELISRLENLDMAESEAKAVNEEKNEDEGAFKGFMIVEPDGDLKNIELADLKKRASANVINKLHEVRLTSEQLDYLELESEELINKGWCSAIDVLQMILEKKLVLKPGDKDMIVMLHEISYLMPGEQKEKIESSFIVKGENSTRTAMAKTVGLPLGIAAKLILQGTIKTRGLHIPIIPEIYEPVLIELERNGIVFKEKILPEPGS